jgi:hypothetical protein
MSYSILISVIDKEKRQRDAKKRREQYGELNYGLTHFPLLFQRSLLLRVNQAHDQ